MCHLLVLYTTMNHFLIEYDIQWKADCTWQLRWPAQGLEQKKKKPKALAKAKLVPKKSMVTIWWSASNLIHYSFLILSKPITSEKHAQQIDEMHWKLQHLRLQSALVNRKGPIPLHNNAWPHLTTNASKVEQTGLSSFASSSLFTWPLANWLPLL